MVDTDRLLGHGHCAVAVLNVVGSLFAGQARHRPGPGRRQDGPGPAGTDRRAARPRPPVRLVGLVINLLTAGAAAAVEAVTRYVLDQYEQYRSPGVFACGACPTNITGSFVLGLPVGLGARHGLPEQVVPIVGVGFCNDCATFSAFSYELVHLREKGQVGRSLLYGASTLVMGLLAATTGLAIGSF